MPRKGRSLERLVAAIERAINNQANIKIESPGWRVDKKLNRRREHDVLITVQQSHHTITIALECRDRGRRVGAPDVEAFQNKCHDTGIDRGIIVSSTGFRRTALVKAKAYNIDCFDLAAAETFDWCLAPGVTVQNRKIEHVFFRGIPDGALSDNATMLVEPDGVAFSHEHASNAATQLLNKTSPTYFECDGDTVFLLRAIVNVSNLYGVQPDGTRVKVSRAAIALRVLVSTAVVPFDLRIYRNASTQRELYSTAVANVEFDATAGKLVMVHKDGEGALITWVPEKKEERTKLRSE